MWQHGNAPANAPRPILATRRVDASLSPGDTFSRKEYSMDIKTMTDKQKIDYLMMVIEHQAGVLANHVLRIIDLEKMKPQSD